MGSGSRLFNGVEHLEYSVRKLIRGFGGKFEGGDDLNSLN
jgi:hypothetical protein